MKLRRLLCGMFSASLALTVVSCEDEGPMERTGRRLDSFGERVRYGDESSIEKAERKGKARKVSTSISNSH